MVGYFTRVLPLASRFAFAVTGVLLLMPFEAATLNAWLNVAGLALGAALVVYELRKGKEVPHVVRA